MEALINLLSDQNQSLQLIKNLASYVIYMYPGVIGIMEMDFLEAKSTKETKAFIVKMFAISYIYNVILGRFINYNDKEIIYNICLITISFTVPFTIHKIKNSKVFEKICEFLRIRTCITSVPFELMKNRNEDYTCLRVYVKNSKYHYIGYMENYEYESGVEKYIILSGYLKAQIEENGQEKIIEGLCAKTYSEKVYLKLDIIELIEKISEENANEIYKKISIIDESKEKQGEVGIFKKQRTKQTVIGKKEFEFDEELEYNIYRYLNCKSLKKKTYNYIKQNFNIQSYSEWEKYIENKYCGYDNEKKQDFEKHLNLRMVEEDAYDISENMFSSAFVAGIVTMVFNGIVAILDPNNYVAGLGIYMAALIALIFIIFQVLDGISFHKNKKHFFEEYIEIIKNQG